MKRYHGFTLIELLVVIAIIAILAAILFPVFAQAKVAAKKTTDIAALKQMSTAAVMYQADSDDIFNTMYRYQQGANDTGWVVNSYVAFPNGWPQDGVRNSADRMQSVSNHWTVVLFPYVKSYEVYSSAGQPDGATLTYPLSTATSSLKPAKLGREMNGMLHGWPASAIAAPSDVIMFWPGMGAQNAVGWSFTNPVLTCDRNQGLPCLYRGDMKSGTLFSLKTNSMWAYGQGSNFAFTDTSAKFRTMRGGNSKVDPWTGMTNGATNNRYFTDDFGNPWLFRPDYQP